jgi:ribosomal protein L37AE/L43A
MASNQSHELLQQWTTLCPACGQAWLIVDRRENSLHTCKECGHQFVINEVNRAAENGEDYEDYAA